MLRRLGLKNFKCWKELDIELAPITLFFGVNSSGKTALLESLLMLKQTAQGVDPGRHINFGGTERDYVDLGSYRDVVNQHDEGKDFGVSLSWKTSRIIYFATEIAEPNQRRLESVSYEAVWGIDDHIYISELRYEVESVEVPHEWVKICRDATGQHWLTSSFSAPEDKPDKVPSPESCYVLPWTAKLGPENERFVSLVNLTGEFERFVKNVHYIGPIRRRPERHYLWTGGKPDIIEPDGQNTIQALIASAREDRYLLEQITHIMKDLDLVEDFNIVPIDKHQRLHEATVKLGSVDSSLMDVGFGISQFLPVVTMLMSAPRGTVVLLEQPELHLHPNAQAALADLMIYAAEAKNLQLIVESHSEHIVRRLQRRIAEASPAFAKPDNIKIYYCQPGELGSTIDEVDVDRFGQISNWPERFMGDISGDLHSMAKAAIEHRRQELERVGSGS